MAAPSTISKRQLLTILDGIRCDHSIVVESQRQLSPPSSLPSLQCVVRLRHWHALVRQIRQFIFENAFVNNLTSTTITIMSKCLVERIIHVENGFAQVEHTADVRNQSSVKLAEMDTAIAILDPGTKLHFVDLCCALGGFLDYVLLRKCNCQLQ